MYSTNEAKYANQTKPGVTVVLPIPLTFKDPTASNDYNAATISSLVFGIFMALLTLYMIWQNGVRCFGKLLLCNSDVFNC
jgi:hypothetical protein